MMYLGLQPRAKLGQFAGGVTLPRDWGAWPRRRRCVGAILFRDCVQVRS